MSYSHIYIQIMSIWYHRLRNEARYLRNIYYAICIIANSQTYEFLWEIHTCTCIYLGDYMKPCIICSLRDIYIIRFTFIIIRTFVRTYIIANISRDANKSNIRRYEFMRDFWITNNPLLIGRDAVLDSCDLI